MPKPPAPTPLKGHWKLIMGGYLVALPLLLVYLVYKLWPTLDKDGKIPEADISLFGGLIDFNNLDAEVRLILIAMVVGALGACVHAAKSFADFSGNRKIYSSWVWWYVLKPIIGLALAVVFYFAIRAGLLSTGDEAADISPYGVAAIAGIVGMFSDRAAEKMAQVFDVVAPKTTQHLDPMVDAEAEEEPGIVGQPANPVPAIARLEHESIPIGSDDFDLSVEGNNFLARSQVRLNGIERLTTPVSANRLTVRILAADRASGGEAQVTVFNPEPGGGTSNAVTLRIE